MFTRSAKKRSVALIFIALIKSNLFPDRKTNKGFISQMSEKASIARIFKGIVRVIIWLWRSLPTPAAYKLITGPIKAAFVCRLTGGSTSQQMKTLSGERRRKKNARRARKGTNAYIRVVRQLDLQLGLCGLGLGSHRHGDDLGVDDRVVPGETKVRKLPQLWVDFTTLIRTARYRLPGLVFGSVRKARLHLNVKRSSGA